MLLSEIKFGSYLTYSPHGTSELEKLSQDIRYKLKTEGSMGNPPKFMSEFIAEKIKENIEKMPFKDFFGSNVSLVPMPRSSLMKTGTLWVSEKIAKAMSIQGFGKYYSCLTRIKPVPKAAFSKSSDRPKAIDHYNTIACQSLFPMPTKIVMIDDVITRGATILGCASRLKEVFPDIPIQAFAVLRTISNPRDFKKIEDPCIGKISLISNETFRNP